MVRIRRVFVANLLRKKLARFYVNTGTNPPTTTWVHPLGVPPTPPPPPNPYGPPSGPPPPGPGNPGYGYNNPQGQYQGYGSPGYQQSPPQQYYGNSPPPQQGYGPGPGYGGYREEESRGLSNVTWMFDCLQ
ncbi:hypothetical protein GYMLUDRAFT_48811 [Collybiopsis luxurians FD-317 M1]|uniref:Uncharacterized protein n=1 Tax=Collybiopsis luxurians FD-317 M1 TaxID=944289 RepID=A0A0D0CHR9_9AGAR|nr:hypothetical protein GYMLUDRAFT_48811 [Collybiopsis luxurians FD-317 M1]